MAKVEILEGGSYLVMWNSLKSKVPDCRWYEIFVEIPGQKMVKAGVADLNPEMEKKGYSFIIPGVNYIKKPLPKGTKVHVIPFVSNKMKVAKDEIAICPFPQPDI